jgi:hypothetical protein
MRPSGPENGHASKPSSEQSGGFSGFRTKVHGRIRHHLSAFGRAVRAVWPVKPALHLSQIADCSERSAQYQIDGERKVTATVMHAFEGELLERGNGP